MEYSFFTEHHHYHLKLDNYSLTYSIDGKSSIISYAQVDTLRMEYPKSIQNQKLYSCTLATTDGPTIKIKSFNTENNEYENQFNHYNQFIRVLHIHLMTKSKSQFKYGMSLQKCLIFSFLIIGVLLGSYFLNLIISNYQVIIYIISPVIVAYLIYQLIIRRPVVYKPELIPYEILPGSSN